MTPRLNPFAAAPAPMQKWLDFGKGALQTGLEESLMELVEIRASQITGCAACLHMHTAAARKRGESEERLYLLDAWRESHAGPCRTGVDLCPAHVAARALRLHQWLARVRHRRAGRYAANHRAAARERQDRCNLRHPQSGQVASYCGSSPPLNGRIPCELCAVVKQTVIR